MRLLRHGPDHARFGRCLVIALMRVKRAWNISELIDM